MGSIDDETFECHTMLQYIIQCHHCVIYIVQHVPICTGMHDSSFWCLDKCGILFNVREQRHAVGSVWISVQY